MKRKNIVAVLIMAVTALVCAASPFFVSRLLDEVKVGEIQRDETPTRGRQEELSLTEAIRVYMNPVNVIENRPDNLETVVKAQFAQENPEVYAVVKNAVFEMQEHKFLSDYIGEALDEENSWVCQTNTFVDAEGSYVTVWSVTIMGRVGVSMEILADQGKVIFLYYGFPVEDYPDELPDAPEEVSQLAESWGSYLGLIPVGEAQESAGFQYQDRQGEKVVFSMNCGTDSFSVEPTEAPMEEEQEMEEQDIQF